MSKAMFSTAVAVAIAAFVPLQQAVAEMSVDEIVGKYIEAVGGKDAIKKLENRETMGKFSLPDMGMEAPMHTIVDPPNMWSEINVESMGMIVHRGITDGVAWEVNPMQGPRIVEGAEKMQMMRQADLEPWLHWKDYYKEASVEGEEEMGEKMVYKVVFTPEEGEPETYYFDKESGLIVGTEAMAQGMTMSGTISDYKEVDGVKVATTIEQVGGQMGTVIISMDEIKHNVDIDESKFELPDEIKALQGGDDEEEGEEAEEAGE